MQIIINIIVFILVLGTIVTIHEFGHFIAAKFFHVYCGSFSIGMGPKIFSKQGKETAFELRALPIGGFVTMAGETDQEENDRFKDIPLERTLKGKKTYQKLIIFLAGIFMNFVLAIVIMLILNLTVGVLPVNKATVGSVVKNTPAAIYGLKKGDTITNIECDASKKSYVISSFNDLNNDLTKKALNVTEDTISIDVTVTRDNQSVVIPMKVSYDKNAGRYTIGFIHATRRMNFTESIRETFKEIGTMSVAIFTALRKLALNFSSTVKQMSGPIGIYQITAQVTQSGQIANLFYLMALLSVNIGVFNLLPIPGLDGAQALFAIIEGIIGRELPQKVKFGLQIAGMALVLALMLIVTFQDIGRLFR